MVTVAVSHGLILVNDGRLGGGWGCVHLLNRLDLHKMDHGCSDLTQILLDHMVW